MKDNPNNPIAVYLDRNNDGTRVIKTDVELLSEVTGRAVENLLGDLIPTEQALSALSLKSNQLQATVDELKQRCEELEKYARHKDGCEERSYYQSSCKKCGYLLKDHDGKFCVVLNDGKISYHKAEQFDPNLKCTCGLDKLLTPNERK